MPGDGIIRVALDVSGRAAGEMSLDGIFGCVGEEICRDDVTITNARAIADFQIEVAQGEPTVSVHNVDLELAPEDLSIQFSECGIDDVANSVIEFARDTLLDVILAAAENLAEERLAPRIEELIAGFATYDADLGPAEVALEIVSARAETGGMFLQADIDATSRYPAAECLGGDPGDPDTQVAEAPDLAAGVSAHLGVAVNLGLLDDALYHVWRAGLMCMTDDHLTNLGVEIDLDRYAGGLLPGFAPGTEFGLDLTLARPPKMVASESGDARISLVAKRVQADLTGRGPDGDVGELHAEIDLEASARVAVDRSTNALVLAIEGAEITRLHLEDEVETGVDPARLEQIIEEQVLPTALSEVGEIPVTGSIFGVTDYYVLLREVRTLSGQPAQQVDQPGILFSPHPFSRRREFDEFGAPTTRKRSVPGAASFTASCRFVVA